MEKLKRNKGITLIALIITIIILLILAGISIVSLTGKNGILDRTTKAQIDTDIIDTKEQIKLEIMKDLDAYKTEYTNQDVINAVEKITGNKVAENTEKIQSKKGNSVDISDLWLAKEDIISFTIFCSFYNLHSPVYTVPSGTTWTDVFNSNLGEQIMDFIGPCRTMYWFWYREFISYFSRTTRILFEV